MHPYLTELLVHDHHLTLEREAHEQRLAKTASAARASDRRAPATWSLMPHVQERGRLRRAIVALLRTSPA
jgi:hypothetical protein